MLSTSKFIIFVIKLHFFRPERKLFPSRTERFSAYGNVSFISIKKL